MANYTELVVCRSILLHHQCPQNFHNRRYPCPLQPLNLSKYFIRQHYPCQYSPFVYPSKCHPTLPNSKPSQMKNMHETPVSHHQTVIQIIWNQTAQYPVLLSKLYRPLAQRYQEILPPPSKMLNFPIALYYHYNIS